MVIRPFRRASTWVAMTTPVFYTEYGVLPGAFPTEVLTKLHASFGVMGSKGGSWSRRSVVRCVETLLAAVPFPWRRLRRSPIDSNPKAFWVMAPIAVQRVGQGRCRAWCTE